MKTLQELYEEIKTSDELKKELSDAVRAGKVTEFLKANDCASTAEELKEFAAEKTAQDKPMRELSLDELEMVAGGDPFDSALCSTLCSDWACWF
ncbi:MAG: hypothetical protein IJQ77_01755 [Synergistaceae bacterium]|nr:hypothetical protein [Synergistaceae bacterium]MBR0249786.1 hypothetical protein [Synergistaceae bacterium]